MGSLARRQATFHRKNRHQEFGDYSSSYSFRAGQPAILLCLCAPGRGDEGGNEQRHGEGIPGGTLDERLMVEARQPLCPPILYFRRVNADRRHERPSGVARCIRS